MSKASKSSFSEILFKFESSLVFSDIIIFVGIFENGGLLMAVSYNKLWKLMIDKKLSKTELTHIAGISTNAMAKLGRDEDVRVNILEKICIALDCNVEDIVEFIAEPTMEEK